MAIAVLVLGFVTLGAGISLLIAGGPARQAASAESEVPNPVPTRHNPVSSAAVQITDPDRLPPIPRPRVTAPAGTHPLLEFSHPALAVTGLACWFGYVISRDRPVAWLAIVFWGLTAGFGLRWLASNVLAAKRHDQAARRSFPRWLVLTHGLTAAALLSVALLTALAITHN